MPSRPPKFLVATMVAASLLLGACSNTEGTTDVDLATLADDQEAWDGRPVRAQGVLRTFDDPRHYWIEDADLNRVELVPHDGLAGLVGEHVRVEGRFTFREGEGRRITIDQLEVLDDGGVAGAPRASHAGR